MKVIIFGATGMVGQGTLRECLANPEVESILSIGRTSTNATHAKFKEIVHDLQDFKSVESQLRGYDACFFCLGTPSSGKSEAQYTRITYDLTLNAAKTLSALNPQMTFIYVSGEGADSSEKGRIMWARVRGKTENDLFRLPFKAAYVFRPGIIQPLDGIQSKTKAYRIGYNILKPLLPALRAAFPAAITTTADVGRAMIHVAKFGAQKKILTNSDLNNLSKSKVDSKN